MKKIQALSVLFVGLLLAGATGVAAQEDDIPFDDDDASVEMSANEAFNLLVGLRIQEACDTKCDQETADPDKTLVKYAACTKKVGLSKELLGIAQKLQKRGYLEAGVKAELKATVEEYNSACEASLAEEDLEEDDNSDEPEDDFQE
jgi:hypothetical protein